MLDNQQLIDSMILDCNNAVGAIAQGQYILFCRLMYEMVQKLGNLKKGVAVELKNREEIIAGLKDQLRNAGMQVEDIPMEVLTENEHHD